MFTNTGLVLRLLVAVIFIVAGLLLLRRAPHRFGAALITIGGTLSLVGDLYGLFVLRPFVGRFFDEQWHVQIDIVDALSTFGLLLCAGGLVVHALRTKPGSAA
jgi:hypothetical protein